MDKKTKKKKIMPVSIHVERNGHSMERPYAVPSWLNGQVIDVQQTNDIVRLFNFTDGTRALDCHLAFKRVQKVFGRSFDFVFGVAATKDFKFRIASCVAEKFRAYVAGDIECGVRVGDCEGVGFTSAAVNGVTSCYGRTILIPTGEISQSFGIPVWLRLDVESPVNERAILQLKHILFADEEGCSIAGLADVTDFIEDLDVADKAFCAVLGKGHDLLELNARIYSNWSSASGDEFTVDLSDLQSEHNSVELQFTFAEDAWKLSFVIDGSVRRLCEIVSGLGNLTADWSEVGPRMKKIKDDFKALSDAEAFAAVNFEHIFDDQHLQRFSDSFMDLLITDAAAAVEKMRLALVTALRVLRSNPEEWLPFFYNAGREMWVNLPGDAFDASVSLLVPLYITDEDKSRCIPSIYLVATSRQVNGRNECCFPTVLATAVAANNYRWFCRALKYGRCAA